MGHSKADKAESHEKIVKTAAGVFRELGVNGISVADLMKEAGLTHGGFYRHFESREQLVGEAVERALKDGSAVADAIAANPRSSIGVLVDAYLSLVHRDNLASSCAVSALASDMPYSGDRAQTAYTSQVGKYIALISGLIQHMPEEGRRASALAALATLVGAISMSRAVNDEALSREILKSAAEALKAQLS